MDKQVEEYMKGKQEMSRVLYKVKIKYRVPMLMNGDFVESEVFIFSAESDREYFLKGYVVYDYQDAMVKIHTTKYKVEKIWEEKDERDTNE